MATKAERLTALFAAIKDSPVTTAMGTRIMDAFAGQDAYRQAWAQAAGLPAVPDLATMTAGQKADLCLFVYRRFTKEIVQASEANAAADAARAAALEAAQTEVDLGS